MNQSEYQLTDQLLMIRPACFNFNPQTAISNTFQHENSSDDKQVSQQVLLEFDAFAGVLRKAGLKVEVLNDSALPVKPDAIFPNNWFSSHADGTLVLYPMLAVNRRLERNQEIIQQINNSFRVKNTVDLSGYEKQGKFLEGTGSLILDRKNRIAYANLSPRTNPEVITAFCKKLNYKAVIFEAYNLQGVAVYHTNVVMALGEDLSVVCTDSIVAGKEEFLNSLNNSGKEVLSISHDQMNRFAGNMLFVKNTLDEKLVILSGSALAALKQDQKDILSKHARMVVGDIPTVEKFGGGSVRCMLAEIFFERINIS